MLAPTGRDHTGGTLRIVGPDSANVAAVAVMISALFDRPVFGQIEPGTLTARLDALPEPTEADRMHADAARTLCASLTLLDDEQVLFSLCADVDGSSLAYDPRIAAGGGLEDV